MDREKYPHINHRQRVREAFRKSGCENMGDRNLLELLLFYAIPRKDTNQIACELLKKYGSLEAVLNAPYDELTGAPGMGESSALLLTVLPEICKRYSEKKYQPAEIDDIEKLIAGKLTDKSNENLLMVCLDAVDRVIDVTLLAEGNGESVTVDKRKILETAFERNADSVILAHNHPFGEAAPSKEDIELTRETALLLAQTGIRLKDHFIVAGNDILSLAQTEKFKPLFIFE